MGGHRHATASSAPARVGIVALIAMVAGVMAIATPAEATPVTPSAPAAPAAPAQVQPAAAPGAPPAIAPLPPVDPGPDESVDIARAPVVLDPPAEPSPLTLSLHPGQELVDASTASALATLGAAVPSFLGAGGDADIDPTKLQPQVGSATLLPTGGATDQRLIEAHIRVQQLIEAHIRIKFPVPQSIDPLALLQALPDGLPRLTYRICSESATRPAVACTAPLPLAVPALVDVTGDGTLDVLADLLPAVNPAPVIAVARELLELQALVNAVQTRLNAVLVLLQNPLALLFNPGLVLEALQLQSLVPVLQAQLQPLVELLTSLVNLGLGLLVSRLPTSETAGGPLPAHVWAVYDVPGRKRLSLGLDGVRRGVTLPDSTLGIFTFDAADAAQGIFDVQGSLRQSGAGASMALTLGLASVAPTPQGQPVDPTVASAQFAPVPGVFDAHALVDPGEEEGSIDTTTDRPSRLDAIVAMRRAGPVVPFGRFTQLVVDQLPTSLSASLTRPPGGGAADLGYRASAPVGRVAFSDFEYAGIGLDRALTAAAQDLPADVDVSLESGDAGAVDVAVAYAASSRMTALDFGMFDRAAANIVATAALHDLPTEVDLTVDLADNHVSFVGNQALGSAEAIVSRNLGAFAPLAGDHATLVASEPALGASARVTGLLSVDAFFGSGLRTTAEFEPGGQPFVAAGEIDGVQKARLDISNLPPSVALSLDPAARTLAYDASAVVAQARAAFTDTASGPTLVATVLDVPTSVDVSWDLGGRSQLTYAASSVVPRVEFFASLDPIETLKPDAHEYLSVAVTGVPTEVDLVVDFPARHIEGTLSAPLESVSAVSRFPFGARVYSAVAVLTGVPAHFDADFADGLYRLRGLSGPLGAAALSISNHAGTNAPVGQHLAVRFREATGDFDASVWVRNLSHVEYSQDGASQTMRFDADAEGEPLFLDVDIVSAAGGADDTRLAAVGRIDDLPTTIEVGLSDGRLTYEADRSIGLLAEFKVGKVAALAGLGAPLFDHGVAAVARSCAPGPGCATDDSVFCTAFGPCFGAVGTVNLPGLPSPIVVDLDAKTVSFAGYQPRGGALQLYVELDGLIASVPHTAALATLGGLSGPLDITFGPFGFDQNTATVRAEYHRTSGGLASFEVLAEADTTTSFGDVRGRVIASGLPADFDVRGQFGSLSHLDVRNSAPISTLEAQVTGLLSGNPASGLARLTDIPAVVDLDVTGFGEGALGVPTITYDGHGASTLDGLVQVEADLIEAFSTGGVSIPLAGDAWARITNFGTTTRVQINPDLSVNFFSVPDTDALALGASLESSVPNQNLDLEVFDELGFTGTLSGHVGAPTIHVGGLALSVNGLRSLRLLPGEVTYLTTGIEGDYDHLAIDIADVFIDPEVELTLDVDGPLLLDFDISVSIQDPFTGRRFHLADQVLRESGCIAVEVFGVGTAHVSIFTKPGKIAASVNHIDVFGADGPQALNYIDPIPTPLGLDPALISIGIDLLTVYVTDPFQDAEVDYDPDFGGC